MNTLPCNEPTTTTIHKLSLIRSCCNVSFTQKGANILNTRFNYFSPVLGARCVFDLYSTTTKLADVPFVGSVITLQINNVVCFISLGSNWGLSQFCITFPHYIQCRQSIFVHIYWSFCYRYISIRETYVFYTSM